MTADIQASTVMKIIVADVVQAYKNRRPIERRHADVATSTGRLLYAGRVHEYWIPLRGKSESRNGRLQLVNCFRVKNHDSRARIVRRNSSNLHCIHGLAMVDSPTGLVRVYNVCKSPAKSCLASAVFIPLIARFVDKVSR